MNLLYISVHELNNMEGCPISVPSYLFPHANYFFLFLVLYSLDRCFFFLATLTPFMRRCCSSRDVYLLLVVDIIIKHYLNITCIIKGLIKFEQILISTK